MRRVKTAAAVMIAIMVALPFFGVRSAVFAEPIHQGPYISVEQDQYDISVGETVVIVCTNNDPTNSDYTVYDDDGCIEELGRETVNPHSGNVIYEKVSVQGVKAGTAYIEFSIGESGETTKRVTINVSEDSTGSDDDEIYIRLEKDQYDISVGETVVVDAFNNDPGNSGYTVHDDDGCIDILDRECIDTADGELNERVTVQGLCAGTAYIEFRVGDYGEVTETVTINVSGDSEDSQEQTGWKEINGDWYYYDEYTGDLLTDSWVEDETGDYYGYYVDEHGKRVTGWKNVYGDWHYFDKETGLLVKDDWVRDSKGWMWQNEWGDIVTDCWITDGDKEYYLKSNGYMAANEWVNYYGEWYYLKSNGSMAANEWAKDSKGRMWLDEYGCITRSMWIKSGGEWYYLKSNGYMAAKEWAKDSGGWYWMNGSGKIAKNVWAKDSGGWYWMNASGRIAKNTWAKDSKGWCYMGSNGRMVKSKWVKSRGYWYYLNASGHMVTGTQKIGGKTYKFDKSGKWIS